MRLKFINKSHDLIEYFNRIVIKFIAIDYLENKMKHGGEQKQTKRSSLLQLMIYYSALTFMILLIAGIIFGIYYGFNQLIPPYATIVVILISLYSDWAYGDLHPNRY